MDHYLNLKSTTADGTEVITMIRRGTESGNLLSMVKELPHTIYTADYKALTRAQVFCTEDDTMSINVFVFGGGEKEDGEWTYEEFYILIKNSNERINLLDKSMEYSSRRWLRT